MTDLQLQVLCPHAQLLDAQKYCHQQVDGAPFVCPGLGVGVLLLWERPEMVVSWFAVNPCVGWWQASTCTVGAQPKASFCGAVSRNGISRNAQCRGEG